jgi:transcriptional regulator with XRE-family HTH domain
MAIGSRIRRLREELGINQQELADRADLTQATISRIESGRVEQLKSDALRQLADALRVTVDYLLGRSREVSSEQLLESDPDAEQLVQLYGELTPENRRRVLEFAWFLRLSRAMDLEQLGQLQKLLGTSRSSNLVDRQIAILRMLADLSGTDE